MRCELNRSAVAAARVLESVTVPADLIVTTDTDPDLADEFAAVAAVTFPLACPPGTTDADTAEHIARHLTAARFRDFLTSPDHDVLGARVDGTLLGYALLDHTEPTDPEVCAVVTASPVSEVSKMYVLPEAHGTGASHALMAQALTSAREHGSVATWLGVSNVNLRAQRFYAKMGFTQVGHKSFWLNGDEQRDFVMLRPTD